MAFRARPYHVSRRQFLRTSAAALGVGALATVGTSFGEDTRTPRVVYRRLGRTDFRVSHIVAAWDWNEYLYGEAVAAGINYWHKIGGWAALPKEVAALDRGSWYCDVAIDTFEEEGAYDEFEWARKNLGLGYVDAFKLHSIYKTPEDVRAKTGMLKAFDRLKAEGKVRHLAGAQHGGETAAICAAMIESGHFDHLQPALSVAPTRDMLDMLALAEKHDVGIIAKKVMGAVARAKQDAGIRAEVEKHLGKDGKWGAAVIKTVIAYPGVTAVTPHASDSEQLNDNLSTEGIEPTPRETAAVGVIQRFARAEQCSYCGLCLGACPRGLAIPETLRYETYHTVYGNPREARRLYAALPPDRHADRCSDCGACERACPQGMRVREKLREAAVVLA